MSVSALLVSVRCAHEILSSLGIPSHTLADSGAQPLTNADDSIVLAVNGEIYNHRLIRKNLKETYHFKTHSDCEVIIPLVRTRAPPCEIGRG